MDGNSEDREHHRLTDNEPKGLLVLLRLVVIPSPHPFSLLSLVTPRVRQGIEEGLHACLDTLSEQHHSERSGGAASVHLIRLSSTRASLTPPRSAAGRSWARQTGYLAS